MEPALADDHAADVAAVSVPYRSGKWVEPGLHVGQPARQRVSVPYRSGKWVEQCWQRASRPTSSSFSPLPFGEVGGTMRDAGEEILEGRFSPLPFGEVGGTCLCLTFVNLQRVSGPYRSGKWVEPRNLYSSRSAYRVSVPYRSGKWVEQQPSRHRLVFPKQRRVSVPYRSGKWVEPANVCGGYVAVTVFQSPTVRGGGWNAESVNNRKCYTSFSPLPFGEVGGTMTARYRHLALP